jgi:hypothetical protein
MTAGLHDPLWSMTDLVKNDRRSTAQVGKVRAFQEAGGAMINLGRSLIVMALAWPIPAAGAFLDANDLYARCDVPSNTQQINICAAYVEGVVDALTSTKALCPPGDLAASRS